MKRVALVFDFDETLAQESTTAFVESLGINTDYFWSKMVDSLLPLGWDPVPAYLYKLIDIAKEYNITKELLNNFGEKVVFKNGVETFFNNIKNDVKELSKDINIEFYIISSGISEIIKHTKISKHFNDIWACEFHFDKNNLIKFPKKIVSFTDKTRYIFQISKGMFGSEYQGKPYAVNLKIDPDNYYIPIKNMIYLGDGMTDVPCFSLLQRFGGTAIAVYDAQNTKAYGKAQNFKNENRVNDMHIADYSRDSKLYNYIFNSIKKM